MAHRTRCSKELPNLSLCYGCVPTPTTENISDSDEPFADLDSEEENDATASSSEDDCLMGEIITDDLETYSYNSNISFYFIVIIHGLSVLV